MLAAWLRAKYPNAVQVTHATPGYMRLLFNWASLLTVYEDITKSKAAKDQVQLPSVTACCEGLTVCVMQGSIAASAPVRAFASRLNPSFIPSAFWEVSLNRCKSMGGQAGMGRACKPYEQSVLSMYWLEKQAFCLLMLTPEHVLQLAAHAAS